MNNDPDAYRDEVLEELAIQCNSNEEFQRRKGEWMRRHGL